MIRRLVIATVFLCVPMRVAASGLGSFPTPLSPYVEEVLKRADGIYLEYISTLPESEECVEYRVNAIQVSLEEIRKTIDANRSLIMQSRELKEMTVCHKFDLQILEMLMEKIRTLTVEAADECMSLPKLKALSFLHTFVLNAYDAVLHGGLDPTWVNFLLRENATFIPENYDVHKGNPSATACPFHSDYAPPSLGRADERHKQGEEGEEEGKEEVMSFGCDITVLEGILENEEDDDEEEESGEAEGEEGEEDDDSSEEEMQQPPEEGEGENPLEEGEEEEHATSEELLGEIEALINVLENAQEAAEKTGGQIVQFQNAFQRVMSMIRRTPLPPTPDSTSPEHGVIAGCREEEVESEGEVQNGEETMDEEAGEVDLYAVETWTYEDLPQGMILRSTYDPFSIYRNTLSLMEQFITVLYREGEMRPLPLLSGGSTFHSVVSIVRKMQHMPSDAARFERSSGLLIATSADEQERVYAAVYPLRSAVRSFGQLASFPDPSIDRELPVVRAYIRDLALFLRRSCVRGLCNEKLDDVLRRVFNNSCFPYGTSCFLNNREYIEDCYQNRESIC